MKISTKLLLLVSGSIAAMAAVAFVYTAVLSPVEAMVEESASLNQLSTSLAKLRSEAALLATRPLVDQAESLAAAKAGYEQAWQKVEKITLLQQVNETLAQAISICFNLRDMSTNALVNLESVITEANGEFEALGIAPSSRIMTGLLNPQDFYPVDGDQADVLKFQGTSLMNTINAMNDVLVVNEQSLAEQHSVVATEVAQVRARSLLVSISLGLVIIGVFLVLAVWLARSIARSLKRVESTVEIVTTGDFTRRFPVAGKDEVAQLGRNLNTLLDSLNSALGSIQADSRKSLSLRDELARNVSEATSSSIEIQANTDSIRKQMERLDGMIGTSTQSVATMAETIGRFHGRLNGQNQEVDQSTTAVTQILASIGTVSRIAEMDKKLAKELTDIADEGRDVFEDSFEKVAEIATSMDEVKSVAELIAGIAGQTTILAMNAAIEAAHAGEYGKGFAVVADEIGKLANASAASSAEISHIITAITQKIEQATNTKDASIGALDAITTKIDEVSQSIEEIYGSVREVDQGGRLVLGSMEGLRASSHTITEESNAVRAMALDVGQTFDLLVRISTEVTSNLGEITLGLGDITQTVRAVVANADNIGEVGTSLDEAVRQFKTEA